MFTSVANLLFNRSYTTRTVEPYKKEHYSTVRKIAYDHLPKLTSMLGSDTTVFESQIKSLLQKDSCLVSLESSKPVGFLTYHKFKATPWTLWRKFAKIEHLAVDSTFEKKGHGQVLLNTALTKLEKEGINFVTLEITDLDLQKYYRRFGFRTQYSCQSKTNVYGIMIKSFEFQEKRTLSRRVLDQVAGQLPRIHSSFFYLPLCVASCILLYKEEKNRKSLD